MTLVDEEYNDEFERNNEEDQAADSENKEIIHAAQGLSIVVQCNPIEDSEENRLQKNVFHTKCTAQDKVCLVIIDSDNFENVILMEMVQKLNLKTVPHPNPYRLCWL